MEMWNSGRRSQIVGVTKDSVRTVGNRPTVKLPNRQASHGVNERHDI